MKIILFTLALSLAAAYGQSQTLDMVGPPGSGEYGSSVTVLANGNYVVSDPSFSEAGINNIGAVYLYNGSSNNLVSTVKGSTANDRVGSFIIALNNGNFVIGSTSWNNGAALNAGAVTWCNGITGLNGTVSSANSLVGSSTNDRIGQIFTLTNGNYVVASPFWSNAGVSNAGAATWCNGTTGLTGTVSIANSLVGTSANDYLGNVAALSNGNYVVYSSSWHNGAIASAGAVTWCNGTIGLTGAVNSANSFVGTGPYGLGTISTLSNGNYLISSSISVTWANGSTAITGSPDNSNSWMASAPDNNITGAVVLANDNYLVIGTLNNEVSVTWADGTTGVIGTRTAANSFLAGLNVIPLASGAYALSNPYWNENRGAAILCKADGSTTGTFNNSNSLVGTNPNDYIGSAGITPLVNNNFVVGSPNWNGKRGAATLCLSDGSTVGFISSSNSLVGTNINDSVGGGVGILSGRGAVALTNGNYVVNSPKWNNNRGAVTWGNGITGVTGEINVNNSLVGSSAGDRLGIAGTYRQIIPNFIDTTYLYQGVIALGNGNYIVAATGWNGNTGSVTWCNGRTGYTGTVNSNNSFTSVSNIYNPGYIPFLSGVIPALTFTPASFPTSINYSSNGPSLSRSGGIENVYLKNLTNNYVIQGIDATTGKATISWGNGNGGTKGITNACNTVYGAVANGINNMRYVFDSVYNYLLVSRPAENTVSRYYPALGAAIPQNNDNSSSTISGNSQFVFPSSTGCGQIAALTPSGTNPVSGTVIAKTWLEPVQPVNYVARHYEITPALNPATATATVTLYFTQADFDGFNNQTPAPALLLPTSPSDAAGIGHLLVQKEGGTSNVGTGLPGTYPGVITTMDPADGNIVWNTSLQRWELSFDVTGFSGFFIKTTALTALPLRLLNFGGKRQGESNQLQWKTANETGTKTFEVQSSADGSHFQYTGTVAATGGGNYFFNDGQPLAVRTYYRLKMMDADRRFTYSNIIWVDGEANNSIGVYPNPVLLTTILDIGSRNSLIGTQAILSDASGRVLKSYLISNNKELLEMAGYPTGLYFLKLKDGSTIKIVKQ